MRWIPILLLLWGCSPKPTPEQAQGITWQQNVADGAAKVTPGTAIEFPRDHGAHPEYGLEWWYLTANLTDEQGEPVALQWTLFRSRIGPQRDNPWDDGQLWFAHLAIEADGRHHALERWARGGNGQAGVTAHPFNAWIDHWQLTGTREGFLPLTLTADSDLGELSLTLSDSPIVKHGINGFSQKTPDLEHASLYYSLPHLKASGTLTQEGRGPRQLQGLAWMDREWSSELMDTEYLGWDWLSLHLDDGRALMLFRMRSRQDNHYFSGSLIDTVGGVTPIHNGEIQWRELDHVTLDGASYPVAWQLEIPNHGLFGSIETRSRDQRNQLSIPYWEGPVTADGSIQGEGFIEMTGY
ncbi:lipocalin-like domain-containing protein [Ferrimonas sediminicola]|nr:lipocalin-like domain-containing protein [Ferrimonas sediminicola]